MSVVAPFHIPHAAFAALPFGLARVARTACDRLLALPALNAVYRQILSGNASSSFCQRALRTLRVDFEASAEALQSIPTSGPLIVIANHPFGGIDGLILTALLQRVRPDMRLLANFLLNQIPDMHPTCFFVDPFGGPAATARNLGSMKSAIRWVQNGGALAVFPAGEVSHFTLSRRCVTDPPWDDSIARLVVRTRATVQAIFFEGRNSRLFQAAGLLHPRLRTALLPRELLWSRGRIVQVEVGSPIPYARLERRFLLSDRDAGHNRFRALTEYLRIRTYVLKGRRKPRSDWVTRNQGRRRTAALSQSIVAAAPAEALQREIEALPPASCLVMSGAMRAIVADAGQIPQTLREIARLREMTFRQVGEGTGRALDLDPFDDHYKHLFVWNDAKRQVIGAYRIGLTDELLQRHGAGGLYTSTLFDFRPRLLAQLNPALELGRSFVIPEYQRDYSPLLLLWKGIGRFVAARPRYRKLFGVASISDDFQSLTRQLLLSFLRVHKLDSALAVDVHAKHPPRNARFRDTDECHLATLVQDLSDVEELVCEIESDRKSVPVLLRHYLRLNAKLLGFNIDPDFFNVLDGLVLVDLVNVERPLLNRYLGAEGAATFLQFHAKQCAR